MKQTVFGARSYVHLSTAVCDVLGHCVVIAWQVRVLAYDTNSFSSGSCVMHLAPLLRPRGRRRQPASGLREARTYSRLFKSQWFGGEPRLMKSKVVIIVRFAIVDIICSSVQYLCESFGSCNSPLLYLSWRGSKALV